MTDKGAPAQTGPFVCASAPNISNAVATQEVRIVSKEKPVNDTDLPQQKKDASKTTEYNNAYGGTIRCRRAHMPFLYSHNTQTYMPILSRTIKVFSCYPSPC